MSDQESILKLTIKADIAEAVAYAKAVDQGTEAVRRHTEALANMEAKKGGGAGPAMATGTAATGAPPPAPHATSTGPAPAGSAASGQAPPPPAAPAHHGSSGAPPITPQMMLMGAQIARSPAAPGSVVNGGAPPAAPQTRADQLAALRGGGGGGASGRGGGGMGAGASMLSTAAGTAAGIGMGTSLTGFFMAAPQRYMALSTVITQVGRKFREAGENAAFFGASVGYTISEAAQLSETLGKQTNTVNRAQFQEYASFARFTGSDPGGAMNTLGSMERMQGRQMSSEDIGRLLGAATSRGMDQGRLDEFMQQTLQIAQMGMAATGKVDPLATATVAGLPGMIFGKDDPRASGDMSMVQGLQQTMTGGGAMQSYMMRAMGFGKDSGPGYIEMRKRLEAGIHDPQNLVDLFGSFQERGMGEGAMFKAIESVSGGKLKAHQIEALVGKLGNAEGLLEYGLAASGEGAGDGLEAFRATLSENERKQFDAGGFTKMVSEGEGMISAGEASELAIERMMMKVGKPIADSIPSLQGAIENIGGMLNNLVGVDWGTLIPSIAANIERVTGVMEGLSGGRGFDVDVGGKNFSSETAARRVGALRFAYQEEGLKGLMGAARAMGLSGDESELNAFVEQLQQAAPEAAAGGGN